PPAPRTFSSGTSTSASSPAREPIRDVGRPRRRRLDIRLVYQNAPAATRMQMRFTTARNQASVRLIVTCEPAAAKFRPSTRHDAHDVGSWLGAADRTGIS